MEKCGSGWNSAGWWKCCCGMSCVWSYPQNLPVNSEEETAVYPLLCSEFLYRITYRNNQLLKCEGAVCGQHNIEPTIRGGSAEVGWDQVYSGKQRRRKQFDAGLYCTVWVHRTRKVNCQGLDILEMKSYWIRWNCWRGKNRPRSKRKQCLGWLHFHIFSISNSLINSGIIMQGTEFSALRPSWVCIVILHFTPQTGFLN